jgi:hypothetical protein
MQIVISFLCHNQQRKSYRNKLLSNITPKGSEPVKVDNSTNEVDDPQLLPLNIFLRSCKVKINSINMYFSFSYVSVYNPSIRV